MSTNHSAEAKPLWTQDTLPISNVKTWVWFKHELVFVFGGRCLNILTVGMNTDDSSDSDIKLNHESNTKLVSIPFMSRLGRGERRRGDDEKEEEEILEWRGLSREKTLCMMTSQLQDVNFVTHFHIKWNVTTDLCTGLTQPYSTCWC